MAVTVAVTTDQPDYAPGDTITATVAVDGADPGSQKTVTINAVATVDGLEIQSPAVSFSVTDPPAEVVVVSVVSDDPAVVFAQDPGDQFVWAAVAA